MSLTGQTQSLDFPTHNAYQATFAWSEPPTAAMDAFISRFSSSGTSLFFSTYLGGRRGARGAGLAEDDEGRVIVVGFTESLDFPVANPYQSIVTGNGDGYVCIFSSGGSSLIFSTYFGGRDGMSRINDLTLDTFGAIYIVGHTSSHTFPTFAAYQSSYASAHSWGDPDAFLSKFSSLGSSLFFSTYLGGSISDIGEDVFVNSEGEAYITGRVESKDFPTVNPYQAFLKGDWDAFIAKFSSSGTALIFSGYLGGGNEDRAYGISIDSEGCAYIAGETDSADFPTSNSYQASLSGAQDAFIAKFTSSGSALTYSTFLGGSDYEYQKRGITVNTDKKAYVAGETMSDEFPTRDAYQSTSNGDTDLYIACLVSSGSALIFSTYLGGKGGDSCGTLTLDALDLLYLTGSASSTDFPTVNPYQASLAGPIDVVAVKLRFSSPIFVIDSGDYNGDGTSDIAVFRPANGYWAVRGLGSAFWGSSDDLPASGDYDGNETTEAAVFRSSTGLWAIRSVTRAYFGSSGDISCPADYDGDGRADIAVFRPSSGLWSVHDLTRVYFGTKGDLPVPGDWNGDGAAEVAVFRASSGLWAMQGISRFYFGTAKDWPVPNDYDFDGIIDWGIFRPSTGMWSGTMSKDGPWLIYFGSAGDRPMPAHYGGWGKDLGRPAIWRASTGLWSIRNLTRVYFGSTDDVPVTR